MTIDMNMLNAEPHAEGGVFNENGPQIAKSLFAGLFQEGSGKYALLPLPDWNSVMAKVPEMAKDGLQLIDIDTFRNESEFCSTSTWQQSNEGMAYWATKDWNSFYQTYQQLENNLRLIDLDILNVSGVRWYLGVWMGPAVKQQLVHDLTWDDFGAKWEELCQLQGYRLTKLQAYYDDDTLRFTGIFEVGIGEYGLYNTTDLNDFIDMHKQNERHMQLVDFQVVGENDSRRYLGVWRETSEKHQFVYDLDWGSFVAKCTELSNQGLRLRTTESYSNPNAISEPKWDEAFKKALGATVEGYAYVVAMYGKVVSSGVFGNTRSPFEPNNPNVKWSLDSRINLASVSKTITAVAVLKLLEQKGRSVDEHFHPFIANKVPTVGQGVESVTIRNLLTMKSGMVPDFALGGDLWAFLKAYLAKGLVGTPGQTPAYSNTNATILQGVINELSGQDYVSYVTQNVLIPMGIDPHCFNAQPDPHDAATLCYKGQNDKQTGLYFGPIQFVAPGGWVASANELIKFLIGLRNNSVLSEETTNLMISGGFGCWPYDGIYGRYHHHNGGLGGGNGQQLNTGIVRFTDGYDALLLVNSPRGDIIDLIVRAFETR